MMIRKTLKPIARKNFEKWADKQIMQFEPWAEAHKLSIEYDSDLEIYVSSYTQIAWMAYEQCLKDNKHGNI